MRTETFPAWHAARKRHRPDEREREAARDLRRGYFRASTGAAAALIAASERPGVTGANVCRGGRPDLAGEALDRRGEPKLSIGGGGGSGGPRPQPTGIEAPRGTKDFEVGLGATRACEEPVGLDRVASSPPSGSCGPGATEPGVTTRLSQTEPGLTFHVPHQI